MLVDTPVTLGLKGFRTVTGFPSLDHQQHLLSVLQRVHHLRISGGNGGISYLTEGTATEIKGLTYGTATGKDSRHP
jgi:hypothetical protein